MVDIVGGSSNFATTDATVTVSGTSTTRSEVSTLVNTDGRQFTYTLASGQEDLGTQANADIGGLVDIVADLAILRRRMRLLLSAGHLQLLIKSLRW